MTARVQLTQIVLQLLAAVTLLLALLPSRGDARPMTPRKSNFGNSMGNGRSNAAFTFLNREETSDSDYAGADSDATDDEDSDEDDYDAEDDSKSSGADSDAYGDYSSMDNMNMKDGVNKEDKVESSFSLDNMDSTRSFQQSSGVKSQLDIKDNKASERRSGAGEPRLQTANDIASTVTFKPGANLQETRSSMSIKSASTMTSSVNYGGSDTPLQEEIMPGTDIRGESESEEPSP